MKRTRRLTNLIDDVEELLGELSNETNPQVQELRRRVEEAIIATKRALAQQGSSATARIGQYASSVGQYASSVDGYISDYPRLAFVTGALIFGTVGYLTGVMRRAAA
jgi:ElaB/YqjD/DUF883 family membrane-anchored ribosome-binding protein